MLAQLSIRDLIEQELASEEIQLPVSGPVAGQLAALLDRKEPDSDQLTRIIERDPSLTAKVLNLSNSAYYAGLVRIRTVDRAIARVGLVPTQNFLLSAVVRQAFSGEGTSFHEQFLMNWRHSLGCAMGSRRIAQHLNLKALGEEAYFLGLLHDIGNSFIFNALSQAKARGEAYDFSEGLVREITETFHPAIGAKVLARLNFDERYCRIVAAHHDREPAAEHLNDPLFNILEVANQLMRKLGISISPDEAISLMSLESTAKLGLDALFVASLEVDIEEELQSMDALL